MRHESPESFALPAERLRITEAERDALLWFADAAERGVISDEAFDMESFCGSACCIGGYVAMHPGVTLSKLEGWERQCFYMGTSGYSYGLHRLYFPVCTNDPSPYRASVRQAAVAIRVFLAGLDPYDAWRVGMES